MDIDDIDEGSYNGSINEPSSHNHRDTPDSSGELENILKGLHQNRPGQTNASQAHPSQSSSSHFAGSSTRESDLTALQHIWLSERTAPEILPFDEALIDRIMSKLREQVCV